MESVDQGNGGSQRLVAELVGVLELVQQLGMHLNAADSSVDHCRDLIARIVALTDKSIGIAAAHFPDASTATATATGTRTPQPLSGTSSPLLSDVSDQPFRTNARKRKATARWTSQVRVSAAVDDGQSWRKYGQKDILGAKHPRGYYRCTHRNSQGCAATKQVQRTDEDPALFDVVYHNEHTCRPTGGPGASRRPPLQHNPHAQNLLQSLSASLTVDTENSPHATVSPPMPENRSAVHGVSPSMASPLASDSNGGLSMSAYPMAGYGEWTSDGELQEVVSALTTVSAPTPTPTPMPTMETEFMPYYFEFDPTFDIDAASLFM